MNRETSISVKRIQEAENGSHRKKVTSGKLSTASQNGTSGPQESTASVQTGFHTTLATFMRDEKKVVPATFENCAMDDLVELISLMLLKLVKHNDQIPLDTRGLTRFHSRAPPTISIQGYLARVVKYTTVEPSILLSLLPYADRISERAPNFVLSSLTVHRFIIAAASVGSKALSDSFCTSTRYARVGGISLLEMAILERELCSIIDWRLITPVPMLDEYYRSLVKAHPDYALDDPVPGSRLY